MKLNNMIQNIINNISSKVNVANSIEDEDITYYSSEAIARPANDINVLPHKYLQMRKYRQMRKINKNGSFYNDNDVKIFYEQAMFMQDFEDDFSYTGEFIHYFPTYQAMSDNQLRGYFSWRTKLRKGEVAKTSLSYVFVYIYELLNQVGVSSALDGYHKLMLFWQNYKEHEPRISHYMKVWLTDYVIYYNLDKNLLLELSEHQEEQYLIMILNYKSHTKSQVVEALNYFSSYNIFKSKLYKTYPEDVTEIAYTVFDTLSDYYEKNRKNDFCTKCFGVRTSVPYPIFKSAIFLKTRRIKDGCFVINEINQYIVKNNTWYHESYPLLKKRNKTIGELLKTIDSVMREMYNLKSQLTIDKPIKLYIQIIKKTVEELQVQKKQNEKQEVNIDITKFNKIRESSIIMQERLVIAEETVEMIPEIKQESGIVTAFEKAILKQMMNSENIEAPLKEKGILLSVFIDDINEKLFDTFNDSVIAYDGNIPVIIEDYLEDVRGLLQ